MKNYLMADFLTGLKNAYLARKKLFKINFSNMVLAVAKIMKENKLAGNFKEITENNKKFIEIELLYKNKKPAFSEVKIISKPSIHIYQSRKNLFESRNKGIIILSTSKGIMTDKQAKKANLGGEIICQIY